jgi:hypothetical protein
LGSFERMRAEVSAAEPLTAEAADGYRLIVQSYPKASMSEGSLPGSTARPLASVQRAVTAEELARGIAVDMLQVDGAAADRTPVIVAWVERGAPDLEFDALRARPARGAVYGVSHTSGGAAQIVLRRHEA